MESPAILYDVSDHVCVITLNRPEVMNAISGTMREELEEAMRRAETDPAVRCVMLTGAGRAFCAGGNISNMVELQERQDTTPISERLAVAARVIRQMRRLPKVVIAAVNGPAVGAGMNIALACDLR
ncbi:MAG: enoyl-CoA hydratase/isomerase family protein, partial [Candidatus Binatia bacterium]